MNKKYWIILLSILTIAAILGSWLPFRLTIDINHRVIGIRNFVVYADEPEIGEIISARTESSKNYYLGNGRYSIDSYIWPIHFKANKESPWLDIDTTIDQYGTVTKAPYDLQVHLDGMPGFYINSKESGEYDVRLKEARADSTSISPVPYDPKVKPIIEGNRATWKNFYPYVDVVVIAGNGGVTLQRIIYAVSSAKEYDIDINEYSKGALSLSPVRPAYDSLGQELLMTEKPITGGRTETLYLEVISPNPQLITYPIYDAIDVQVSNADDDGVADQTASTYSTSPEITYVGYENSAHLYEANHRFTGLGAISQGDTIDVCYISVYDYGSNADALTKLRFEKAANPGQVSDLADFNGRTLTTAGVDWDGDVGSTGTWCDSPSLVTPAQELVDAVDVSDAVQVFHLDDGSIEGGNGSTQRYYSYDYSDNTYGVKLHIEYTAGGGEASIYQSPTNKAFGVLQENTTYWSNGSTPSFPLGAGDCYFVVTNNGTTTIDISANGTNWTGGTGWTLTAGSPGSNTVRMSLFKIGDNATDNLTLGISPLSWISSLGASDNVSWEIKLETGTFTDGVGKTAHVYLIASAS